MNLNTVPTCFQLIFDIRKMIILNSNITRSTLVSYVIMLTMDHNRKNISFVTPVRSSIQVFFCSYFKILDMFPLLPVILNKPLYESRYI